MRKSLLAGIAVAALALSGCATEPEEVIDDAPEVSVEEPAEVEETDAVEEEEGPGTIVDVASAADGFSTLVAAVVAADLVDTLSSDGPFTVFAPTDAAFADLPEGVLDALLEEENRDILVQILTYHVVNGAVFSEQVEAGPVTSVEGSTFAVEVSEEGVVTVNGATVTAVDIEASNGVIHVIDAVILPADLDIDALLG